MEFTTFSFDAFDKKIWGWYSQPETTHGVVVLVHGFGEHSGRYNENVTPAILEAGLAIVTYDNIGHGNSGGKRGHCPSYEALISILETVIQKAKKMYPGLPVFLYGHSMGGNLVLNYALQNPSAIQAVIATSPYLRLAFAPPKWKLILGRIMLVVQPSITLPSGLDPQGISTISEEVDKYRLDPLIHDKVSPMYSLPVIEAGKQAIANAGKLKVPVLLAHGSKDPIIDPEGTLEFHQNAGTTRLEWYEGAFHELHHDFCAQELLKTIQNWLRQQL